MTFPIAPTADYASLVAAGDHTAVVASLRPFFEARSVAVIGASSRRGTIGGELFRNILEGDYEGAAYPVNRNGESVAGVRGYGSIADMPDPVDLAVVCVPAAAVLDAVQSALDVGVKAVCVISAGFAEVGSEGEERQRALLALIRAHGARLLGPNCLGISSAAVRLERDLRLPLGAAGQHRLLVAERSARARLARSVRVARPRALGVRLDRQQGGRLLERPARVVGGRSQRPTSCSSTSSRSAIPRRFGTLARRVARIEADPRRQERNDERRRARGELAHRGARRLRGRSRCAVPPGGRHPGGLARGADRRRGVAVDAADAAWTTSRHRSPTPAVSGSSVPTPARPQASSSRASATRRSASSRRSSRRRPASPIPSTCSARRPDDSYRAVLPLLLADPAIDAVIALFVPAVSATAEAVATRDSRGMRLCRWRRSRVLAVVMSAEGIPAAVARRRTALPRSPTRSRPRGHSGEPPSVPTGSGDRSGTIPDVDGIDHEAASRGRGDGARRHPRADGSSLTRRASSCSPTESPSSPSALQRRPTKRSPPRSRSGSRSSSRPPPPARTRRRRAASRST